MAACVLTVLLCVLVLVSSQQSQGTGVYTLSEEQTAHYIQKRVRECRKEFGCRKSKACADLCRESVYCTLDCPSDDDIRECLESCRPVPSDFDPYKHDKKRIRKGVREIKDLIATIKGEKNIDETQRREIVEMFKHNMSTYKHQLQA